ncbi:MAG: ABC transporter ATP-binding protein [Acidimicrobiales bacterium]
MSDQSTNGLTDGLTDGEAPVLEFDDVDAGYGPFRALFGVSFSIRPGSAIALVGPNGAGKSTVARVASGLVTPSRGRVLVDGVDLTAKPPFRYARAGIAHSPEGRAVFATLSVEENLRLAFHEGKVEGGVSDALDQAFEMFPKLRERRKQAAGTLSGGEQRMLTLARVLVLRPRLLIADELSLGLAPIVTSDVYRVLHQVRDAGCALLVVEQHLDHALELADEVVTLSQGEVGYCGPPAGLGDLSSSILLPVGAPARAVAADHLFAEAEASDGHHTS